MKKITFGRLQDNDIVFDDKSVSRHHGYLLVEGGKVYVVDDDSLNGIYVNGKRIDGKTQLSYGDKVLVAKMFKLDWQNYAPVEAEKTVLNNKETSRVNDTPTKTPKSDEKKSEWKKTFWKTVGKYLKYIISTIITLAIMTFIRKLF